MKSFQAFRLDTANQCLWRDENRVAIPPKVYDVLRYLVENPNRLVSQDEILEKLWSESYVNPELIRKYILEIRKILGDRLDKPEFIETVPKRGYRFIAPVTDEDADEPPDLPSSQETGEEENVTAGEVEPGTAIARQRGSSARHGAWKLAIIALVAVIALVGLHVLSRFTQRGATAPPSNNRSIAVLPFADMSPAKDQEYFSDGLSEQLIHDLAKVPGLKVVGRSSAFQFRGKNEDLRQVGRTLGVSNVLEGSVRRDGNRLRITAELIKADDGFELWSQTYEGKINDVFAVQDEIAQSATRALQLKLLGDNGQAVASNAHSANPEAYQAYLQANYISVLGHGKEELDRALAYADTAIKLDDKYAPAWALRASVENRMAEVGLTGFAEGFQRARHDAEQAIALDPSLASAYLALARTHLDCDWDWDAANTLTAKAMALEPSSAEVFRLRSYLSRALGDLDQGIKLYEQAVALDPLRTDSHLGLGYLLYIAGRYGEAQAELQKALDLNPQAALAHVTRGKILLAQGKKQQALSEIEKEPLEWAKLTGQVMAYHALGREQDSKAALASLIAKNHSDAAFQIAQAYAYRGEFDKSFEWLDHAYTERDPGLPEIKTDPLFRNLQQDPRYTNLLKRMHLPT
jgi:TolB-like protein/DNA-binding winged helix-turn-helix (wHTH) protein/Tfp pilus assembly protein PilF